jgi:hypothetical protein
LSIKQVDLATNRIIIHIQDASRPTRPVQLEFAEQSSWLVARVSDSGWLNEIESGDAAVFKVALTGLFKLSAVDLVREQVEHQLMISTSKPKNGPPKSPQIPRYDINASGLIVWPNEDYEQEVCYSLEDQPITYPRPRALARLAGLNPIPLESLAFHLQGLSWHDWRKFWDDEQSQPQDATNKFPFLW